MNTPFTIDTQTNSSGSFTSSYNSLLEQSTELVDCSSKLLGDIPSKYIVTEYDSDDDVKLIKTLTQKYTNNTNKIRTIDFMLMKDAIRNYRELSKEQIDNIEKLDENQKIEIIKLYNTMFSIIIDILK
jgi:hypothetical protein